MGSSEAARLHRLFESLWHARKFSEAAAVADEERRAAGTSGGPTVAGVRALLDLALVRKAGGALSESEALRLQARTLHEQLRTLAEQNPRHPETADWLLFEAEQLGAEPSRGPEILSLLDRAQKIREERFGPDSPEVGEVLVLKAEQADLAGDTEKAAPLFGWALRVLESRPPDDLFVLARALQGHARSLAALGRDREAVPVFERAIALHEGPAGDPRVLYFLLLGQAGVFERLHQTEKARQSHRRAEQLLPRTNPGAQGYHV